jgi:hypothetical protein
MDGSTLQIDLLGQCETSCRPGCISRAKVEKYIRPHNPELWQRSSLVAMRFSGI